jgi:hypothetical protein
VASSRTSRARTITRPARGAPPHPLGTPTRGLNCNTGSLATAAWLIARGFTTTNPKWFVEIALAAADGSEGNALRIELFDQEWGFVFRHRGQESWIRVTDVRFVHGKDDFALLGKVPPLKDLGLLVRALEERFAIRFDRAAAGIQTSVVGAESAIREWVLSL